MIVWPSSIKKQTSPFFLVFRSCLLGEKANQGELADEKTWHNKITPFPLWRVKSNNNCVAALSQNYRLFMLVYLWVLLCRWAPTKCLYLFVFVPWLRFIVGWQIPFLWQWAQSAQSHRGWGEKKKTKHLYFSAATSNGHCQLLLFPLSVCWWSLLLHLLWCFNLFPSILKHLVWREQANRKKKKKKMRRKIQEEKIWNNSWSSIAKKKKKKKKEEVEDKQTNRKCV